MIVLSFRLQITVPITLSASPSCVDDGPAEAAIGRLDASRPRLLLRLEQVQEHQQAERRGHAGRGDDALEAEVAGAPVVDVRHYRRRLLDEGEPEHPVVALRVTRAVEVEDGQRDRLPAQGAAAEGAVEFASVEVHEQPAGGEELR